MVTRSKTAIWLIGQTLNVLDELSQLPLSSTILRRVFFEMKNMHRQCSTFAGEVDTFCPRANILTTEKPHVVSKRKIYNKSKYEWRKTNSAGVLRSSYWKLYSPCC